MSYVAVIPSIYQPYTDACLATCALEDVIVVDNTVHNRGCAASWNIGIRVMQERRAEWVVIVSAATRFGERGGRDFADYLSASRAVVVETAGLGWHLIAFHRSVPSAVGLFDENFYPAYFEDNDYGRRITLWLKECGYDRHYCKHCHTDDISGHHHEGCPDPVGGWLNTPLWPKIQVGATLESIGHGVALGGAKDDPDVLLAYYARKWGGPRQAETFTRPYGDPTNTLAYWEKP